MATAPTTCADAIAANLQILKMNRDQKAEYNAKRDLAFNNWQTAFINKQQTIDNADRSIDIGHYIIRNPNAYLPPNAGVPKEWVDRKFANDFWMNHVAYGGDLRPCPNSSYRGNCPDGGTEADHKCCALGKRRICMASGDCGGWKFAPEDPFNEYASHNRLTRNLFIDDITAAVERDIQNLQNIYESMREPEPLPGFDIACCQDISIVGEATDESNIIFDTVTNTCTVNDTGGEFEPVPPIINGTNKPGTNTGTNNNTDLTTAKIKMAFEAFFKDNLSPEVQQNNPERFYGTSIGLAIGIIAVILLFIILPAVLYSKAQTATMTTNAQTFTKQNIIDGHKNAISVEFGSVRVKKNKKRH